MERVLNQNKTKPPTVLLLKRSEADDDCSLHVTRFQVPPKDIYFSSGSSTIMNNMAHRSPAWPFVAVIVTPATPIVKCSPSMDNLISPNGLKSYPLFDMPLLIVLKKLVVVVIRQTRRRLKLHPCIEPQQLAQMVPEVFPLFKLPVIDGGHVALRLAFGFAKCCERQFVQLGSPSISGRACRAR
jgi:hypothetical protein